MIRIRLMLAPAPPPSVSADNGSVAGVSPAAAVVAGIAEPNPPVAPAPPACPAAPVVEIPPAAPPTPGVLPVALPNPRLCWPAPGAVLPGGAGVAETLPGVKA